MEMARSMMVYMDLPLSFLEEAIKTGAYILYRVTPSKHWIWHISNLSNLKVWGYKAHVVIRKPFR